jgi:hypothetical protein
VPAATTERTLYGDPNWWRLMLLARLRPGISPRQALARMNPVFAHAAYETLGQQERKGAPLELQMVAARGLGMSSQDYERPLHVLMGMVFLVLGDCLREHCDVARGAELPP